MNKIEANIAGTKIPLKVSEDEEVIVKRAIEEVNSRIKQYQSEFSNMDIHDCIKMALLTYAVDYHKGQFRMMDDSSWNTLLDIQKQLEELEAQAIS
ncbi:MAG TPA: cell division protein ZapA [Saprospiraceae bacterium]|nr:cell division protein ZapA [Saprospiraceae bacterium]